MAATAATQVRRSPVPIVWGPELTVEAIGTFALIFFGAGSIIATGGNNLTVIGLAHGLAIAVMVAATGHISGGAFNPAVTLALAIARKLTLLKAVAYVLAQLIGALVAALLLKAVFPAGAIDAVALGTPAVGSAFSVSNAFVAEIIATFFLAYVIFGVAIDKRGATTIAGLAIGLAITMDIYATGPISGAAMNPARWFGPAVIHWQFDNLWVWIIGPAIGAAAAATLYFYALMGGAHADHAAS